MIILIRSYDGIFYPYVPYYTVTRIVLIRGHHGHFSTSVFFSFFNGMCDGFFSFCFFVCWFCVCVCEKKSIKTRAHTHSDTHEFRLVFYTLFFCFLFNYQHQVIKPKQLHIAQSPGSLKHRELGFTSESGRLGITEKKKKTATPVK